MDETPIREQKNKNLQESEPVRLEKGTDADLETFFALERKLAGPTFWPETQKEQIYGGNKIFYMIQVGENTVGHLQYEKQDNNVIYLNVIAIDPDYQGKGYGREAMQQFLSLVKGADKIWLVTHPDNKSVHLYESFGFKITERKENYFGNGTPRVVMTLEQHKQ